MSTSIRPLPRLPGTLKEEALGANPRLLNSGQQDSAFYQDMWGRLTGGQAWRGRLRNRRKDGAVYVADVVISPVRDEQGRTRHYVGLQRDITDQVTRDEALRQAQKMEEIGQLTGGIAHDFNNLLSVILANTTLLLAETNRSPEVVGPYLEDIEDAARRGATMVRKLLGFSRKERLATEVLDLRRVVLDLAGTLRRLLPTSIEVRELSVGDPPPVQADRGAVEQMLLNLATNARDAMPEGGILTISVSPCTRDHDPKQPQRVAIEVSDTGTGMEEAIQRRVFEPFFTTKPVGKGTGLGMAMVRGLMEQHGGEVSLSSRPGFGTTVTLCFPASSGGEAVEQSGPEPGQVPGGTERVLLVEDEEPLRRVGALALERLGYQVDTACDGVEALELLEEAPHHYVLVLSDLIMPRLGGQELLAEMRKRDIDTRFLLVTGYSEEDLNRDRDEGPTFLLRKPWSLAELAAEVRRAIDFPALGGGADGSGIPEASGPHHRA